MNKMILLFFVSCSIVLSIHSANQSNTQPQEYSTSRKKARKRARRLAKRKEAATPVLDKQEAETASNLKQVCEPQVFHFTHQPTEQDKSLCLFLDRIDFTHDGIASFFAQIFNRREYGTDFLPHNFGHFIQFLQYGKQMEQPTEFFDGVVRLFNTKLKASNCVNSAAFETMLIKSTPYLAEQFPKDTVPFWKKIKKLLWTNFKNQFSFLKKDPMGFFEDISEQIIKKVKIDITNPDKFRNTIVRFLNAGVDKLAWCPEDQLATWDSFKTIGNQITTLYEQGIINDSFDLNELYWGLVERYCYFLELAGSSLTIETCQKMKQDLASGRLKWLQTEEQEEGLETKTERLVLAFMETEAKARIYKEGILTDMLPHGTAFRS